MHLGLSLFCRRGEQISCVPPTVRSRSGLRLLRLHMSGCHGRGMAKVFHEARGNGVRSEAGSAAA